MHSGVTLKCGHPGRDVAPFGETSDGNRIYTCSTCDDVLRQFILVLCPDCGLVELENNPRMYPVTRCAGCKAYLPIPERSTLSV